jgi:heat shock protein HtpX
MTNTLKTGLLLISLTALIMLIGQYFGGQSGMFIAFIFAMVMNFGSYWFSDKIVLKMYRAKEVSPHEEPELHSIVTELAQRARIPKPKIYVIPSENPNAFATGRNPENAAVAVTEGIRRILNREELEGVLAHELSHVKNRDILISSIAATLAGVVMLVASWARWAAIFGGIGRGDDDDSGGIIRFLLVAILAPLAAMLIQLAISRSREYLADATGAEISGNPSGLASALGKLNDASRRIPMDTNPSTAHMFIVNPLSGRSLMGLFSTHPPIEKRVARLKEMSGI